MRIIKGPVPPSVLGYKKGDESTIQVKVKRKCGRPRNPIPRHKRESHINAEHRRRGKIQDGFRTLKNIVPKYEQSSGRDSKADILFKAVDHCKLLQDEIREMKSSLERLQAEKAGLHADIKNYKTLVPDITSYDHVMLSPSMDDRYAEYVHIRTQEHRAFGTFKVIMRPLYESYKLSVSGKFLTDFLQSVSEWASNALSLSNLQAVCLTTLKDEGLALEEYHRKPPTSDMAPALLSDNNNNRNIINNNNNKNNPCVNSPSLSSDNVVDCREDAASVCSSAGVNNVQLGKYTVEAALCNVSPHTHVDMNLHYDYQKDVVAYNNNNNNNNTTRATGMFNDLYVSRGYDLHLYNHLTLQGKSSNVDVLGGWQHHPFQHPHQIYDQNNFLSHQHLHQLNKGAPLCSGHQFENMQDKVTDCQPSHSIYLPHFYSSETDVNFDLCTPRELQPKIWSKLPALVCREEREETTHKHPPQSSGDKQRSTTKVEEEEEDVLEETEKQIQISSSSDTCISRHPLLPCPRLGSYSTMDQHLLTQPDTVYHERGDRLNLNTYNSPATYLSTASCSNYRETFGLGARDFYRHSVGFLNSDLRDGWEVYGPDNIQVQNGGHGHPAHGYESSSLLAELLSQQTNLMAGHQTGREMTRVATLLNDHGTRLNSGHLPFIRNNDTILATSPESAWHGTPVKNEQICKNEASRCGQSCHLVKTDQANSSKAIPVEPSHSDTRSSFRTFSMSSSGPEYDLLTSISDTSQLKSSPDSSITSSTSTNCLQHYAGSASASLATALCKSMATEENFSPGEGENHVNVFEIAHQHLLDSHCLSPSANHLTPPTIPCSVKPSHTSHTADRESSDMQSPNNTPRRLSTQSNSDSFLSSKQSPPLPPPSQALPMSRDTTAPMRVTRKSSFEESFQREEKGESDASQCKKTCHWLHLSPFKQNSPKGQGSDRHCPCPDRHCPCPSGANLTDCVEKSHLATLGETTLRFL